MVTWDNYEEYMLMHADGELQANEEQALMAFVAQHPELKGELELCGAVKLVPDTTVVYANKEALMKPVPATKKVIAMPVWQRYAVAAGVAAVICLSMLKFKEGGVEPVRVAMVSTAMPVKSNTANGNSKATETVNEQTTPQAPVAAPKPMNGQEMMVVAKVKNVRKEEVIAKEVVQENSVVREQIAELMPAEAKTLPVESERMKMMALNTISAVNMEPQTDKKTLLESLPIEDIKKDGIADVASALAQTYKKMNALKRGITDEKNISVRIEKKQLILSF